MLLLAKDHSETTFKIHCGRPLGRRGDRGRGRRRHVPVPDGGPLVLVGGGGAGQQREREALAQRPDEQGEPLAATDLGPSGQPAPARGNPAIRAPTRILFPFLPNWFPGRRRRESQSAPTPGTRLQDQCRRCPQRPPPNSLTHLFHLFHLIHHSHQGTEGPQARREAAPVGAMLQDQFKVRCSSRRSAKLTSGPIHGPGGTNINLSKTSPRAPSRVLSPFIHSLSGH